MRVSVRSAPSMPFYRGPWRVMMNLFQPSIKLTTKVWKGSRLMRHYDMPQTPLDRLLADMPEGSKILQYWQQQRTQSDPFVLAEQIERQLKAIWNLASSRHSPRSG